MNDKTILEDAEDVIDICNYKLEWLADEPAGEFIVDGAWLQRILRISIALKDLLEAK